MYNVKNTKINIDETILAIIVEIKIVFFKFNDILNNNISTKNENIAIIIYFKNKEYIAIESFIGLK